MQLISDIFNIRNKLYRFAARIVGSSDEAEDVVQEVFMKVWQQRDELNEIRNLEAWSMTLTKNMSLDKLRSKHRRTESISTDLSLVAPPSVASLEAQDLATQIQTIMAQLPENQRQCMHLRDVEGLNYDEIAAILQLSLAQVKTNIHRARNFVRSKINDIPNF